MWANTIKVIKTYWHSKLELFITAASSYFQTHPHRAKPQESNRIQTCCFNCQSQEFTFFDGACAVTSLACTNPRQGHSKEEGEWGRGPTILYHLEHEFLLCGSLEVISAESLTVQKRRRKVKLPYKHSASSSSLSFFFYLVWFVLLQLHLIPTGKPPIWHWFQSAWVVGGRQRLGVGGRDGMEDRSLGPFWDTGLLFNASD